MSKARNLATFGSTKSGHISGDSATFTDTVTASAFVGSGASLTGVHDSVAVQAQIDSAAVTLTGNQTIAGTKTFSSTPKSSNGFEAASAFRFTKSTTSGTDNALYYDSDNLYVGRDAKDLRFRTNFGAVGMGIDSAGSIYTGTSGLGDKLSLYANRLNATNMYGFGIGSGTMYYKSLTYHDFYIAANYDGTSHKVRIDGDGIKFHGDTSAANALDDYEEGTVSLGLSDGTTTISGWTTGSYVKIGQMVTVHATGYNKNITSLSTAHLKITGLPFTSTSTASAPSMGIISCKNDGNIFTAIGAPFPETPTIMAEVSASSTQAFLYGRSTMTGANIDSLTKSDFFSASNASIWITITYRTS